MDELDFTSGGPKSAAAKALYDPAVARACFDAHGAQEDVAEGKTIFAEKQASDRMFFLLEGEVRLLREGKTLDIVRAGEIFGELAVITGQRRTAAAVAKSGCRVLAMSAKQFEAAVRESPEFALMLLGVLSNRLRLTVALLAQRGQLDAQNALSGERAFNAKQLAALPGALKRGAPQSYPAGRTIMAEGDKGGYMYVVLSGSVAVSVRSVPVERIGAGGVLGEMALVDQAPRAATAITETDSMLLPINRDDFASLAKSDPSFGVALLRSMALRLGQAGVRRGG